MNITTLKDRVWFTSQTQGTGTYTSGGPVSGYFDLDEIGHGQISSFVATDGVNVEEFYGTASIGANFTLTRNEIVRSTNGNAPVNWTTGTRNIFCAALAQDILLRNLTQSGGANLDLDGNDLILSADGASFLHSPAASQLELVVGTAMAILAKTDGTYKITYTDSGALVGPQLIRHRVSSSPLAADILGADIYSGKDSAANDHNYVYNQAYIVDPTNGSEDGGYIIATSVAGSMTTQMEIKHDRIIFPTSSPILINTTSTSTTDPGIRLRHQTSGPHVVIGTLGGTCLWLNRDDDGNLLSFLIGGTSQGSVSVSGSTVTYGTFTGAHDSDWGNGCEPDADPPLGAVLCSVDQDYVSFSGTREKLPCVRLSRRRGEKVVYGVFGGWRTSGHSMSKAAAEAAIAGRPALQRRLKRYDQLEGDDTVMFFVMTVHALGTAPNGILCKGPVEEGDYLMSSDEPGVAEVAPEGTDGRYVIGKACGSKAAAGVKTVRATLHAG